MASSCTTRAACRVSSDALVTPLSFRPVARLRCAPLRSEGPKRSLYDSSDLYNFRAALLSARSRWRGVIAHREATNIKAADEYMAMFNDGRTWSR